MVPDCVYHRFSINIDMAHTIEFHYHWGVVLVEKPIADPVKAREVLEHTFRTCSNIRVAYATLVLYHKKSTAVYSVKNYKVPREGVKIHIQ